MSEHKAHDSEKHDTSWRDKTVKAAGYGYLIGDAALAFSGIVKRDKLAATGAIWAAGGLGAAAYGNPDREKQLEILANKLATFLEKNGAHVSDLERDQTDLLRGKNGLGAKLDRFMHEHPTELLNASYAVGSSILLHDGIKHNHSTYKYMGGLVLAGALGGLLIKEDVNAQAKADPNSISSRAIAWVKEKPMRLTGTFYLLNNLFTIQNARKDKANFPHGGRFGIKPHYFSFLTAASYIAANGLLALSSRDQIEEKKFKPEHIAQLEQVAAEIIAAQPPQLQAVLLTQVSDYLAKEKMVAKSPEELSNELIARVSESSKRHLAQATQNTWAARTERPAETAPTIA